MIALSATDLETQLRALQASLEAGELAGALDLQLPAGEFTLSAPITLGTLAHELRLTARGGRCVFLLGSTSAPLASDATAVELVGASVHVSDIGAVVSGGDNCTALAVSAEGLAHVSRLSIDADAASTTGARIEAPSVELAEVTLGEVRSRAGTCVGLTCSAKRLIASACSVRSLRAAGDGVGVALTALEQLNASQLRLSSLRSVSGTATGILLQSLGRDASLELLDCGVDEVTAQDTQRAAIGLASWAGGLLEARALSLTKVHGGEATALLLGGCSAVDVLAVEISDIRGTLAGACGLRLLAGPSTASVAIRDVRVEAVRAEQPGGTEVPDLSWTRWIAQSSREITEGLPPQSPLPGLAEVTGVHVDAEVTEFESWIDHEDPGAILVEQSVLRRISGTALQIRGGLRPAALQGLEQWTSIRAGWIESDRVFLEHVTCHRHQRGLVIGPCELRAANSLFAGIADGDALLVHSEAEVMEPAAVYVSRGEAPLVVLAELPFRKPGPIGIPATMLTGRLAPDVAVDLTIDPAHPIHTTARLGELGEQFVGANPPEITGRCELRDPLPTPASEALPPLAPSPVVDYRARDARALLDVMRQRAAQVMPEWSVGNAADFTTMLFELLAHRLDILAYRQEVAVQEAYLDQARLRRSVEDHARLLDYDLDPGLSATSMLRFGLHADAVVALTAEVNSELASELQAVASGEVRLEVPAHTLVANGSNSDVVVFATETALVIEPELAQLTLAEDLAPGATSGVLTGVIDAELVGQWLIFREPNQKANHVVRVTAIDVEPETTRIYWDPRRASPCHFPASTSEVLGNVVPAHHGVPLLSVSGVGREAGLETSEVAAADVLDPWRELMSARLDNRDGRLREYKIPLGPLSVHASGWPFPGLTERGGTTRIDQVLIDDEVWTSISSLALAGPSDRVFTLRASEADRPVLLFGDGVNGAALPRSEFGIHLSVSIGLGARGNVVAGSLKRLLALGRSKEGQALLFTRPEHIEYLRRTLQVSNPMAAIGGRDREDLSRIRYSAPRNTRDTLSAITPADWERLLERLPEVSRVRARVLDVGVRRVVRLTVLLNDEDILAEEEKTRRWATVRRAVESVRLLGFDVELVPPKWVPLDIDLTVDADAGAEAEGVRRDVLRALKRQGGVFDPDSTGLGGDIRLDAVYREVLGVPGVAGARVSRFRRLEPRAIEYVGTGVLPISGDEVAVIEPPDKSQPAGLLTVTVCGGVG